MDVDYRRTGRTFRTCLHAVYQASKHNLSNVCIVFPTYAIGQYHFRNTLLPIVRDLQGVKIYRDKITLPNGSIVQFSGANPYNDLAGFGYSLVIHDHIL